MFGAYRKRLIARAAKPLRGEVTTPGDVLAGLLSIVFHKARGITDKVLKAKFT